MLEFQLKLEELSLAMLNCLEATRLLSERQERRLSLRERLALWFHLSMCHLCRGFGKFVEQLHSYSRDHSDEMADDSEAPGLSEPSRERIRKAVEKGSG